MAVRKIGVWTCEMGLHFEYRVTSFKFDHHLCYVFLLVLSINKPHSWMSLSVPVELCFLICNIASVIPIIHYFLAGSEILVSELA